MRKDVSLSQGYAGLDVRIAGAAVNNQLIATYHTDRQVWATRLLKSKKQIGRNPVDVLRLRRSQFHVLLFITFSSLREPSGRARSPVLYG
jgi:hypothetical protein